MNRLFQIIIVIALAYITAYYTSNKNSDRELLDIDFNIDVSDFFESGYEFENSGNTDFATVFSDGIYYFNIKEYANALRHFEQAADIDTTSSEAVLYIALCFQNLKDFYEAELSFEEVLVMDSTFHAESYIGLGKIAHLRSKLDTALIHFSKSIEIKPDNDNAYCQRAESYLALKDTTAALKDFEYATYLNQNSYAASYGIANIYYQQKKYAKAEEFYSKSLLIETADLYLCYYYRAHCSFSIGKYNEAINDYKAALEQNNSDAYLYYNIGNSYDYLGDTINSIEYFDLFTISTKEYDSYYDYAVKRVNELK